MSQETTIFRMMFVPLVSIIVMTLAITGFGIDQNSSAQGQGSDNATNIDNNNNANLGSNNSTENTTAPSTITLPLSKGFIDGKVAYFIATDASSKQIVSSVSNTTSFKVNYAPSLANTSQSSRQTRIRIHQWDEGRRATRIANVRSVGTA